MIKEFKWDTHEEWLAIRAKYIGGSDAASVIGRNPYRSAYALWAEKTGKMPGFEGNLTTKVGSFLEDLVADLFEDATGKKVRKRNRTLVNDLYPFACANIDRRVVGEEAFLEIKTTNSIPIMRELRNGGQEFPDSYYTQCVHYLAVTGYQKCYLAVLVNCRELKIYELERDQEEIDALMEAEKEFWDCVINDTPPAPDGLSSTTEALEYLYPSADDQVMDLGKIKGYLDEYVDISRRIKELSQLKDQTANVIKDYMGSAGKGITEGYSVTYGNQERSTFDTKAFKAAHREIDLEPYFKKSVTRTFRVTEKGA
ncbi:MAG: YqaJ viral recombinase family protein [Oscillospiraceae bacterium]|nr:YqaJ viral recombinase family protein [Oscillospiraceae bacterium]